MRSASRTLVKSPPELWEMLDQAERMEGLMSSLTGQASEIKVYERDPESYLGWEARDDGEKNWIEVELAEKGWGTQVKLTAACPDEGRRLEGWLNAVMDELSVPEKRPFDGIV